MHLPHQQRLPLANLRRNNKLNIVATKKKKIFFFVPSPFSRFEHIFFLPSIVNECDTLQSIFFFKRQVKLTKQKKTFFTMPPRLSATTKQSPNSDKHQKQQQTNQQSELPANNQLLRDLDFLRRRRKALENEIVARDLAVFDLETSYLELTGTPIPVPIHLQQQQAFMNRRISFANANSNDDRKNNSGAVDIAVREGRRDGRGTVAHQKANAHRTTLNFSDQNVTSKSIRRCRQQDEQQDRFFDDEIMFSVLENHMSSVRFGDACEIISSTSTVPAPSASIPINNVKSVHATERCFSLSNYSALAACGKNGVIAE